MITKDMVEDVSTFVLVLMIINGRLLKSLMSITNSVQVEEVVVETGTEATTRAAVRVVALATVETPALTLVLVVADPNKTRPRSTQLPAILHKFTFGAPSPVLQFPTDTLPHPT